MIHLYRYPVLPSLFVLCTPYRPIKNAPKILNVLLFTLIHILLVSIYSIISIICHFYASFLCYHSVLFLTDAVSWPSRKGDVCIWMPPFAVFWQKPFRSKFLRFWEVARVPVKSIWYDNSIHSFWNFEPICKRATKQSQSVILYISQKLNN